MPLRRVLPVPAFCAKWARSGDEGDWGKVFLNVTTGAGLKEAVDWPSEAELAAALESGTAESGWRLPMAIGDPDSVADKAGRPATAFTALIHCTPEVFQLKVGSSSILRSFLVAAAVQTLNARHPSLRLHPTEWIALQNRRFVGELATIEVETGPLVEEMETAEEESTVPPDPEASQPRSLVQDLRFVERAEFSRGEPSAKKPPPAKPLIEEIRSKPRSQKVVSRPLIEEIKSEASSDPLRRGAKTSPSSRPLIEELPSSSSSSSSSSQAQVFARTIDGRAMVEVRLRDPSKVASASCNGRELRLGDESILLPVPVSLEGASGTRSEDGASLSLLFPCLG